METRNYIKDLIDRTLINLKFVEKAARDFEETEKSNIDSKKQVFEVTQLINSLLVLVVLPKEKVLRRIPCISSKDLVSEGYPKFVEEFTDFHDLLEKMRNSIAHVDFTIKNENKLMTCINFQNHDPANRRSITLDVTISIEDLRSLVKKISQTIKSFI